MTTRAERPALPFHGNLRDSPRDLAPPELKWIIGKEFAIATGLIEAEAIRGGKPVPATKFRFTRIVVLRDGQWKVLLFQNTMEGTPPPAR